MWYENDYAPMWAFIVIVALGIVLGIVFLWS